MKNCGLNSQKYNTDFSLGASKNPVTIISISSVCAVWGKKNIFLFILNVIFFAWPECHCLSASLVLNSVFKWVVDYISFLLAIKNFVNLCHSLLISIPKLKGTVCLSIIL